MDNKKLGYDKKYQRDLLFENEFEDKYNIKKIVELNFKFIFDIDDNNKNKKKKYDKEN